jgi:hypothetical protein
MVIAINLISKVDVLNPFVALFFNMFFRRVARYQIIIMFIIKLETEENTPTITLPRFKFI